MIGIDKIKHMVVSAVIYWVLTVLGFASTEALLITFLIGLAKECYDARPEGTGFDKADLLADVFGICIAELIVLAIR
ncbi:MAG: hypothetical protein ACTSW1_08400 [Candidatus Hodarchaeales archaeon]